MKRCSFVALLWLGAVCSQAHEFWLQPRKFRFNVGERLIVDFMVGENFEGEFWDMSRHKVERLEMLNRFGKADLLNQTKKTAGANLAYEFASVGTHLLALESNAAYLELDAAEFNAYLEEDGLDYILDLRKEKGIMNQPSREFYTRSAKLLVQSGDRTDETFQREVGLKFEIIPLQNPYDLKSGDYMGCKVLYHGEPAAHTLVKVWSHIGNRIFLQNIFTESDGTLRFPISNSGPWMVSTVRMVPSQRTDADWESMWASLVFEIE